MRNYGIEYSIVQYLIDYKYGNKSSTNINAALDVSDSNVKQSIAVLRDAFGLHACMSHVEA